MRSDYKVINLDDKTEYECLIILCTADSPYEHLENIAQKIAGLSNHCKVLIDEILHVGNTKERYMEFTFENGRFVDGRFVTIPKSSNFRALSCDFLKSSDVMEGSIISSIQYRMINKGIVI